MDEYILYAALPSIGVLACIGAPRAHLAIERRWLAVCRVLAVTSLAFAALAKLNADFFAPPASCAGLGERLTNTWSVDIPLPGPHEVFLLEALAPALLLVYPRAGLLVTIFLLTGLAHIGPTAFATMLLATACAFLPEEDGRALRRAVIRRWWVPLVASSLILPLTHRAYAGDKFVVYGLFEIVVLGLTWSIAESGIAHLRAEGRRALRPASPGQGLEGTRRVVALVVVLAVFNGLTPYLGLKYRYSFAMLSNLRVDRSRWNSYVIPEWFYVYDEDPFVRVLVADGPRPPQDSARRRSWLLPGLYAPGEFTRRLRSMRRAYVRIDLQIEYLGRRSIHPDALRDEQLLRWARSLPERRLFQSELRLRGPQPCIH